MDPPPEESRLLVLLGDAGMGKSGPHNIGWTFPDEVNSALLDFLRT